MQRRVKDRVLAFGLVLGTLALLSTGWAGDADKSWRRHTIDTSSRGADGVRLADVNGNRLPDLTTGWEEGGQVRVYLHPGVTRAKDPWPALPEWRALLAYRESPLR